ncbi:hypothetical protein BTA51_03340 [Hahella sp. CCB-MM4]|uniref:DUF1565 domain-containing protein n=1 Tax=Hahella sp. (strain CCB-MM4) TaxID=1926491 RepID=UPI000B9AA635|nr:DUF1565 domain-containing protein [Hahella sp. CCB-MM4]OZG75421.1 hypothetical protein BTA51_03340 [Hahella sp. CCB-MM4]
MRTLSIFLALVFSYFQSASVLAFFDQSYEDFQYPNLHIYHVSPTGDDANPGTDSAPLRTINAALELAQPGERIFLHDGHYYQDVRTVRDGEADRPILIYGSKEAELHGAFDAHIIEIHHSYIHLRGFTIDGKYADEASPESYRGTLIWVQGIEPMSGPKGVAIRAMRLRNAGGECVRIRYFVSEAEIFGNTFYNCGVLDFQFNDGTKNGEAIYVGTAPGQWGNGKNLTSDPDHSHHNWIHDNSFLTNGNECVDIKDGSEYNLVENNICTGQRDPNSGGFNIQGDRNILRNNISFANNGAGIRIGGHMVNGYQYGVENDVYSNVFFDNGNAAVKMMAYPQSNVCGNDSYDNALSDYVGISGAYYEPDASCSW